MHISTTKSLGKLFSTHMHTKTILIYNNKFLLCTCSQIWLENLSLYFVLHSYKWQSTYWSSACICARFWCWTARFTRFRRTRRAKSCGDACRRTWWWWWWWLWYLPLKSHREILQKNMSVFLITEWFLTISHFGKKPSIYLKSNSHFGN